MRERSFALSFARSVGRSLARSLARALLGVASRGGRSRGRERARARTLEYNTLAVHPTRESFPRYHHARSVEGSHRVSLSRPERDDGPSFIGSTIDACQNTRIFVIYRVMPPTSFVRKCVSGTCIRLRLRVCCCYYRVCECTSRARASVYVPA